MSIVFVKSFKLLLDRSLSAEPRTNSVNQKLTFKAIFFKIYANNDTISVNETNNSYDLADQLTDGDRTVVVTTRQKMQNMFKRIDELDQLPKRYENLKNMRLAFIVDECHRTITPSQKREIDKFFNRKPLWYGFTGTPIFNENGNFTL